MRFMRQYRGDRKNSPGQNSRTLTRRSFDKSVRYPDDCSAARQQHFKAPHLTLAQQARHSEPSANIRDVRGSDALASEVMHANKLYYKAPD